MATLDGMRERTVTISSADRCGSMSTTRARPDVSANTAASSSVSVVFPTPPFWEATAITHGSRIRACTMAARYSSTGARHLAELIETAEAA